MSVHLFDSASEDAGDQPRSGRRLRTSTYLHDMKAVPGAEDPATGATARSRTETVPRQGGAVALERWSLSARLKQRVGAALSRYSGKMLDELLTGAPVGIYAAMAEQTVREEQGSAGRQRPARAETSPNDGSGQVAGS